MAFSASLAVRGYVSHIGMAAHLVGLATIALLLIWSISYRGGLALHSDNKNLIINSHPVIMFIGFIFVAGEAIMAYNTIPAPKKVRKTVHTLLQLVAISMAIFGIHTAFRFHKETETSNMYTIHSWLGMITVCLLGLQWLFGFFVFWFPGLPVLARGMAVPWHIFLGLAIFLMALTTAQTGFAQKTVASRLESIFVNSTAIAVLLFGIIVCFATLLPRLATQTTII